MATPTTAAPTRRDRLRAQTLEEIEQHALAVVDQRGGAAVSVAVVAKAMGMTAPALYRYITSRGELLDRVITLAYTDLARALERAGAASASEPAARLRAVLCAYHAWAVAHPRRYQLLFGERPEGVRDTGDAGAAIDRGMAVVVDALAPLVAPAAQRDAASELHLDAWARRRGREDLPPRLLELALLTWTRVHGIVGLETAGALGDMELDGGELLDAEIGHLLTALAALPGHAARFPHHDGP